MILLFRFSSSYRFFLLISWNTWALLPAPKTLLFPGVLPCSSDLLTLFQWLLGPVQLRSAGKLIASTHYCSPSPELLILEVWGEAKEPVRMNSHAGDSNIGGLRGPTWEARTCCWTNSGDFILLTASTSNDAQISTCIHILSSLDKSNCLLHPWISGLMSASNSSSWFKLINFYASQFFFLYFLVASPCLKTRTTPSFNNTDQRPTRCLPLGYMTEIQGQYYIGMDCGLGELIYGALLTKVKLKKGRK